MAPNCNRDPPFASHRRSTPLPPGRTPLPFPRGTLSGTGHSSRRSPPPFWPTAPRRSTAIVSRSFCESAGVLTHLSSVQRLPRTALQVRAAAPADPRTRSMLQQHFEPPVGDHERIAPLEGLPEEEVSDAGQRLNTARNQPDTRFHALPKTNLHNDPSATLAVKSPSEDARGSYGTAVSSCGTGIYGRTPRGGSVRPGSTVPLLK